MLALRALGMSRKVSILSDLLYRYQELQETRECEEMWQETRCGNFVPSIKSVFGYSFG